MLHIKALTKLHGREPEIRTQWMCENQQEWQFSDQTHRYRVSSMEQAGGNTELDDVIEGNKTCRHQDGKII